MEPNFLTEQQSTNHPRQGSSVTTSTTNHFGSILRQAGIVPQQINHENNGVPSNLESSPVGLSGRHYVFFLKKQENIVVINANNRSRISSNNNPRTIAASEIAFSGTKSSSRFAVFSKECETTVPSMFNIHKEPVGCKGCGGLSDFNDGFRTIHDFLSSTFGKSGYQTNIPLYTAYRVKPNQYQESGIIYRSDPCCHLGFKERHDWALFDTKQGLRVGQIMSFLVMDRAMIDAFNSCLPSGHGRIIDKPGDFALVQLFNRAVPGLVDPTFHAHSPANVMQANSVLLFFGTKQVQKGRPVTRVLSLHKIKRPLVVLPDFHPAFSSASTGSSITEMNINISRRNSFIVVRPRDLWHEVFVNQAVRHYQKLKPS